MMGSMLCMVSDQSEYTSEEYLFVYMIGYVQ